MKKTIPVAVALGIVAIAVIFAIDAMKTYGNEQAAATQRGCYLVVIGGCNDCRAPDEQGLRAIYQCIRSLGPAGNPAPPYLSPGGEPNPPLARFVFPSS